MHYDFHWLAQPNFIPFMSKRRESEILEKSESSILPPTPQPCPIQNQAKRSSVRLAASVLTVSYNLVLPSPNEFVTTGSDPNGSQLVDVSRYLYSARKKSTARASMFSFFLLSKYVRPKTRKAAVQSGKENFAFRTENYLLGDERIAVRCWHNRQKLCCCHAHANTATRHEQLAKEINTNSQSWIRCRCVASNLMRIRIAI